MRNIYHHQQQHQHHHHHHHNTVNNLGLGEENDITAQYEHQYHNNHHHGRARQEPSEFLAENYTNATYQKNVLIDNGSSDNGEFYKVNNYSKQNSKQQQINSPKQIIRQFNQINSSNVFPAKKSTSTNDANDFNVNTEQKINDYIKFKPMNNKMQASFSTTSSSYYNNNSNNNHQNSKLHYNLNNAQMSSTTTPPSSSTSPVSLSSSTNNILTASEYHHNHSHYPYQYQQQRIIPFKQHKLSTASTISTSSSSSMSFLTNNTSSLNTNNNSNDISNHFTLNQNGEEASHVNYDEDHDNTIINENQQHTAIQMPIIQQQQQLTAGSTSRSSSSCSSYSSLGVALETHNQKINSANPPNQHRGSSLQIRNNIIQQQKNQQGTEQEYFVVFWTV